MGKLVKLILGQGNFTQGFSVTLQIYKDGSLPRPTLGKLPPSPEIPEYYDQWQEAYRLLGLFRLDIPSAQRTNISILQLRQECKAKKEALQTKLTAWYTSSKFDPVRKRLEKLAKDEEIRIIIQTQDK